MRLKIVHKTIEIHAEENPYTRLFQNYVLYSWIYYEHE